MFISVNKVGNLVYISLFLCQTDVRKSLLMKKKTLITGLNSIIGSEVFRYASITNNIETVVAQRLPFNQQDKRGIEYRFLDFNDPSTFQEALKDIETVFLVIPRNIKSITYTYSTFLYACKAAGVKKIIFASIYRGKFSIFVPHHKVENLIKKSGIDYVIVQPTYFMQNLTTFFIKEIKEDHKIAIPHMSRKFNWIDARNAAEAITKIISQFDQYKNQIIPLMGNENKNFMEVTAKLTASLTTEIIYTTTLSQFLKSLKRKGLRNKDIIALMIFMFSERFDSKTDIIPHCENIIKKKPTRLIEFLMRHLSDLSS